MHFGTLGLTGRKQGRIFPKTIILQYRVFQINRLQFDINYMEKFSFDLDERQIKIIVYLDLFAAGLFGTRCIIRNMRTFAFLVSAFFWSGVVRSRNSLNQALSSKKTDVEQLAGQHGEQLVGQREQPIKKAETVLPYNPLRNPLYLRFT